MLLSSSNRKYPPFPFLSYFVRGCVSEMIVTSYSVTYCIYIPEKNPGILFSLLLHSLRWVQIVGYVLACRSYSLVCALYHVIIIILQTYLNTLNLLNASQIYFVECVSNIKHILSVIHHTIYGAVCFQFSVFPWWWLREYIYIYMYILCLIIITISEVWTIIHCVGLGHETKVCAVWLSIFLYIHPYTSFTAQSTFES